VGGLGGSGGGNSQVVQLASPGRGRAFRLLLLYTKRFVPANPRSSHRTRASQAFRVLSARVRGSPGGREPDGVISALHDHREGAGCRAGRGRCWQEGRRRGLFRMPVRRRRVGLRRRASTASAARHRLVRQRACLGRAQELCSWLRLRGRHWAETLVVSRLFTHPAAAASLQHGFPHLACRSGGAGAGPRSCW
jgi:hypothetical protein